MDGSLADWNKAMDRALARGAPLDAAAMAQIVLRELPRHLATYQRLLRMAWALKRWDEGEDWARRLLQADPGNALAWRSLARAVEQRGRRGQAHAMWQRAFEMAPYDPETCCRVGPHQSRPGGPTSARVGFGVSGHALPTRVGAGTMPRSSIANWSKPTRGASTFRSV